MQTVFKAIELKGHHLERKRSLIGEESTREFSRPLIEKLIKETEKEQPVRKDENQDSVTEVEKKVLREGGSSQCCQCC